MLTTRPPSEGVSRIHMNTSVIRDRPSGCSRCESAPDERADEVLASLVAQVIHPIKLAVIEALLWIGRPLSSSQLAEVLADLDYDKVYSGLIVHHVHGLEEHGLLEVVERRQVRGAVETFFYFQGREWRSED